MITPSNVNVLLPSDWSPGISHNYDSVMMDYYLSEIYWSNAYTITEILKDHPWFYLDQHIRQQYTQAERYNDFCIMVEYIYQVISEDIDNLPAEEMSPWFTEHATFVQNSPLAGLIIESMMDYTFSVLTTTMMNLYRTYGHIPELIDANIFNHYHIAEFGFIPK